MTNVATLRDTGQGDKAPAIHELLRRGHVEEAISGYQCLVERDCATSAGIWNNYGIALRQQTKYLAAVACYRRAIEFEPNDPVYHGNLGNVLKDLGRFPEALAAHEVAVGLRPTDAGSHHNYGVALRETALMEEALAEFETACRLDPENPIFEFDRALALLYLGRFSGGWSAFEWRWKVGEITKPDLKVREWKGEDFQGKTLLVYPEQGYGDSILASRFLPLVKRRGGAVCLMCKPPLQRLFKDLEGVDRLVTDTRADIRFDLQCAMLSLPGIFKTTFENVPSPARLHIPEESRNKARSLVSPTDDRFKVGIVWSGSVTFKNNASRTTTLDRFLQLAGIPGIRFYSLQKGPLESELRETGANAVIPDIGGRVEDFADTAAVIERLDLVIMTDSAVAHLTGSLGRPVWNLLSFVPYWLYLLEGEQTPWYPSMKLVRQPRFGDWDSVFARVETELVAAIQAKRSCKWPVGGNFDHVTTTDRPIRKKMEFASGR